MRAGQYVGRVGGIAAALGVGVAIFGGTAVAGADTAGPDTRGFRGSQRRLSSRAQARLERRRRRHIGSGHRVDAGARAVVGS